MRRSRRANANFVIIITELAMYSMYMLIVMAYRQKTLNDLFSYHSTLFANALTLSVFVRILWHYLCGDFGDLTLDAE